MSGRYTRSDDVLWRQTEEAVILLPRRDGEILALTGSGKVLWELLAEPIGVDEASEALAEIYGVSLGQVNGAVGPIFAELSRRQAIVPVEPVDGS